MNLAKTHVVQPSPRTEKQEHRYIIHLKTSKPAVVLKKMLIMTDAAWIFPQFQTDTLIKKREVGHGSLNHGIPSVRSNVELPGRNRKLNRILNEKWPNNTRWNYSYKIREPGSCTKAPGTMVL